MSCAKDRIEAVLDRVFARAKPGDTLIEVRHHDGETQIARTEAGISITQLIWFPVMGGYTDTKDYALEEARAKLREWCANDETLADVEARFPP